MRRSVLATALASALAVPSGAQEAQVPADIAQLTNDYYLILAVPDARQRMDQACLLSEQAAFVYDLHNAIFMDDLQRFRAGRTDTQSFGQNIAWVTTAARLKGRIEGVCDILTQSLGAPPKAPRAAPRRTRAR